MHPESRTLALLIAASLASLAAPVAAQPAPAPPPSGLYEDVAPWLGAPAGRLAAEPTGLPAWLEVATAGDTATAVWQPEGRVRWEMRWSEHGLVEKVTTIDGVVWTTTRFAYDDRGHLRTKEVTGPGVAGRAPLRWRYDTNRAGRLVARRPDGHSGSEWRWAYDRRGDVTARQRVNGVVVREERWDAEGRRRSLRVPAMRKIRDELAVRWRRDDAGAVVAIERRAPKGVWELADTTGPPTGRVEPRFLSTLPPELRRQDVLLLLGAPVRHSDEKRGGLRVVNDGYAPSCWLNEPSDLHYDPDGALRSAATTCICGFCVAADAPGLGAVGLEGVDTHWTAGPWVRLDDAVDVTADHLVLTPSGPRAAGELRPGDLVLDADGAPHVLREVERLPPGPPRLGVNLRSGDGTFTAGGLVFASELPRACSP